MAFADVVEQELVNDELNEQARQIRRKIEMRTDPGDLEAYIRCWSEDDVIEGRPCKALVVILKTRGCTWALAGGCTMCGYANESAWSRVEPEQLVAQFKRAWKKYRGEELVKIYTSGSFIDPKEVMPEAQKEILQHIQSEAPDIVKVAFESLPGFLTDENLEPLAGLVPKLEVGVGVESYNDRVLRDSVNKGHGFKSFEAAAAACQRHQVSVKAYLMCKTPFLKECDALLDSSLTITKAAPFSNVMSLNPTNVQGNTIVDALFKRGSFRPPWLWTLVESLRRGLDGAPEFQGILKSDVIAAGQARGAHNCGKCDDRVGGFLKKFKETQNRKWLDKCMEQVECDCRREWELTLALGPLIPAYSTL